MSGWTCEACAKAGRRGYCAPRRCYCGHVGCHAFPSWEPLPEPADVTPEQAADQLARRNGWAGR